MDKLIITMYVCICMNIFQACYQSDLFAHDSFVCHVDFGTVKFDGKTKAANGLVCISCNQNSSVCWLFFLT